MSGKNDLGCHVLTIDGDDNVSTILFNCYAELEAHLWEYAFNSGYSEAETLDQFKAGFEDVAECMEALGEGYTIDSMTIQDVARQVSGTSLLAEVRCFYRDRAETLRKEGNRGSAWQFERAARAVATAERKIDRKIFK